MYYKHISVMTKEAVNYLNCGPGKIYVDCTLGGSGHAMAICEKIMPDGLLIGIDQDIDAIENGKEVLKPFEPNIRLINDNFSNLPAILSNLKITGVDGILLDLGLSFHQLESSGRGFSFKKDEPLDMRMDIRSGTKAEDLINSLDKKSLEKIFKEFGEETRARQIAGKIIQNRKRKAIRTSRELAEIVCSAVPEKLLYSQIHPATRVFMALRIAVNKELISLNVLMTNVVDLLNPEGRLCAIAFHSLEDRIIKHKIKAMEKGCTCPPDFPVCVCGNKKTVRSLTRKALRPTEKEIAANPMSRSARLRAMEKL